MEEGREAEERWRRRQRQLVSRDQPPRGEVVQRLVPYGTTQPGQRAETHAFSRASKLLPSNRTLTVQT
jgi:hypothetical protein